MVVSGAIRAAGAGFDLRRMKRVGAGSVLAGTGLRTEEEWALPNGASSEVGSYMRLIIERQGLLTRECRVDNEVFDLEFILDDDGGGKAICLFQIKNVLVRNRAHHDRDSPYNCDSVEPWQAYVD